MVTLIKLWQAIVHIFMEFDRKRIGYLISACHVTQPVIWVKYSDILNVEKTPFHFE